MNKPEIKAPNEENDFHDSSLIDLIVDPSLAMVTIVTSTPDNFGSEQFWQIQFFGVLRVEYETVGDGTEEQIAPVEIYAIYEDRASDEYRRWNDRARDIGIDGELHHIVLASSFIRGWGENESLEGITLVCRGWKINPASLKYKGKEFSRPRIEGDA